LIIAFFRVSPPKRAAIVYFFSIFILFKNNIYTFFAVFSGAAKTRSRQKPPAHDLMRFLVAQLLATSNFN